MKIAFAAIPFLMLAAAPMAMAPAVAAEPAAKEQKELPKPSKKAMKSMVALADAAKTKNAAAFAAALPEAKANASNAGDQYLIGMLMMNMAIAANDNMAMAAAVDQIAASSYIGKAEIVDLYSGLGGTFSTAKQFDQAAGAYQKGLGYDPNSIELLTSLAEAHFAANKVPDGITALRKAIAARVASEGKAPENYYKRGVGMAYGAKLPVTTELTREWVAAYPNADSWHNALAIYQNLNKRTPALSLEVYRLMNATNSLASDDYTVYSAAAFDTGNYVESQAVIDAGIASGKLKASDPEVTDITTALKAKPKTTAADLAEAAKAVKDAAGRMRVGDRYLAMGKYAEAIELYRAAEGQAGIDQDLLKLHLGIAMARGGDKAGAKTVFASVGGAWKPIASYWMLYTG